MTGALEQLDDFIETEKLLSQSDKLLVAVSGGMDSMFLLHYLLSRDYKVEMAHCNFGLRGEESEEDEKFVTGFAAAKGIKCHLKKFETSGYAEKNGISIQMAARDLRYSWFETLLETRGCNKILTAHHRSDHMETILLNMTRGTGLKGLTGIPAISGRKVRPLLCITRQQIEKAVFEWQVPYRTDSSNESDKYHRNRIRQRVVPELKKINPSLEVTLGKNARIMSDTLSFVEFHLEKIRQEVMTLENGEEILFLNRLSKYGEPAFLLYHLLSGYGFDAETARLILKPGGTPSGRKFKSLTHRLTTHGDKLFIQLDEAVVSDEYLIEEGVSILETATQRWNFQASETPKLSSEKNRVVFDREKVRFPLKIRPWKQGDRIKPLGMTGHKKVSDILIDHKLALPEKEKVRVLVSGDDLLWICGLVMNEDYKITPSTREGLIIEVEEK